MDPAYETLEHQTAPESTRGLFDPPEESPSMMKLDKRRSFRGLPVTADDNRQQPRHRRSRSAITPEMLPNQNSRQNFGLQTLTEEGEEAHRKKRDEEASVTVDSLKDMINTLKTLPPLTGRDDRRASQRRSISSINFTPPKRMSYTEKPNRRSVNDQEDDVSMSREAALAEAEAKLMGTFKREETRSDDTINDNSTSRNNNRRSFNVDRPQRRRFSDAATSGPFDVSQMKPSTSSSKRMSLQLPTLSENTNEPWMMAGRYAPPSKTIGVSDSGKQKNRRSSSNFDDWRFANPQRNPASTFSPRNSFNPNRASVNLIPFTPTRVNFSRDDANPHQRRPLFVAHLPFSALTPLFRSRQLVRGMMRVNKRNRSDAYVYCEEIDADIYVCGSRDRNRALEGDIVAVRLLEVDHVLREKKQKEDAKRNRNNGEVRQRLPDEEDENEIIFGGDGDVDLVKPAYCGVVVAILERAQNQVFSGALTLMRPNNKRAQEEKPADDNEARKDAPRIVWFKATDKRVPLIAIPIEQAPEEFQERSEEYAERLFVGSIKRWPITSLHPFGSLVRELGSISDIQVQTMAILADNNVSDAEFSDQVYSCLPSIPYTLSDVPDMHRRDLREVPAFTIDPAGSTVLDDALSIQQLADDTFEVGVHVADVAYFIKANSPLDKEARGRGVRVDLTHKSVPMFPDILTDQVTNLVPDTPRLAFSVIWRLSSHGKILDTWFGKTVIRSVAKLTYDDAQSVLDGESLSGIADEAVRHGVEQDILTLCSIASRLREARYEKDATSLHRDELQYTFEEDMSEDIEPSNVSIRTRPAAARLCKEFTVLANQCVAQKISSQLPEQALLRRHAAPLNRKIAELCEYAQRYLGVDLDTSSANALHHSVQSIEDPRLRKLVTVITLKTLQTPKYFCTGTLDISKYSHYALNVPLFTHFTAPSRRFVDLVVHRQLEAALIKEDGDSRFYLDRDTVQKLAQHCNVKKEAALHAREQNSMLYLAMYLNRIAKQSTHHVVHREATVVAVFDQYFDVIVPDLNLERRIHLANLPVWRDEFNEEKRTLTMYWKKGVMTSTGEQHRWSLSDDEYEDEDLDEDMLLAEMQSQTSSSSFEEAQKKSASVTTTPKLDERTLHNLSIQPTRSSPSTLQHAPETSKSTHKRQSIISARLSSSTAYSSEHGSQTIKALDKIRIILTVEIVRTPPLIRILASNPYA